MIAPQIVEEGKPYVRPVPHWVEGARAAASTQVRGLWNALDEIEDPEFPVSVVDMGLIYNVSLERGIAKLYITFTSMGCPCMEYIVDDIRARLLLEPGVQTVEMKIVWEPAWTRSRLTPKAAERLRGWGISVTE